VTAVDAVTLYLNELGDSHVGADGTFADFLNDKLIQSDGLAPDFVDPELVRCPDVVFRWAGAPEPSRRRAWTFVDAGALPVAPVDRWLALVDVAPLHPERRKVAREFATFADFETGRNARPAISTIASRLGKERARVNSHVTGLKKAGWLAPTAKAAKGVIVYALSVPPEVAHDL
jgi:hypothetical protein